MPCKATDVIYFYVFLCFRLLLCRRQPVLQHLHRQRFYTHQWFFVSEIHNASEQQSQDRLFIQLSCIIIGPSTFCTAPWSSGVPESCISSCRVQFWTVRQQIWPTHEEDPTKEWTSKPSSIGSSAAEAKGSKCEKDAGCRNTCWWSVQAACTRSSS